MSKPGGLKPAQPVTDDVKQIALQVKGDVESKSGSSFSTFVPTEFSSQVRSWHKSNQKVVAGTNYFVKIDVGGGSFVHARIYKDLHHAVSVHSVKTGKSASDPIEYF